MRVTLPGSAQVLVQKSGYYSRAAAANQQDRDLIKECCVLGVKSALAGVAGCMGHDDESDGDGKSGGHKGELRAIEFPRIKVSGFWFSVDCKRVADLFA